MRRATGLLGIAVSVMLLLYAGGTAANADPSGFNGTVKIHEEPGEAEPLRRNEPHVCGFHLHGFNFDGSSTGTWKIVAWPPTGDGSTTASSGSWGPASADGEWRSSAMTLADGHYKLFWDQTNPEAPGGEKHKVFWVECPPAGGGQGEDEDEDEDEDEEEEEDEDDEEQEDEDEDEEEQGGGQGQVGGGGQGEAGAGQGGQGGAGAVTPGAQGQVNPPQGQGGAQAAGAGPTVSTLPSTSTATDDAAALLGVLLAALGALLLRRPSLAR